MNDIFFRWHIVTSEEYHNGSPVEKDMYFLTDTREIYRGSKPYTESVVLYTNLPTKGAVNRLYINSSTLEGKVYNGSAWVTVIKPIDDSVTENSDNPISSKAVIAYVATEIAKITSSKDIIHGLSWDSAEHLLAITKGDKSTENIVFEGLGVNLQYTASTGILQMLDAKGKTIGDSIKLDLERFVSSGEYDAVNKNIVLYFDANKTDFVTIPVGDLVDTYTGSGDGALDLTVSGNTIKGSIKISTASGNIITVDENGLYVAATDISGKMDKVDGAVESNIPVFNSDGQVVDSGKSFDDIIPNNHVYMGSSIEEALSGNIPVKNDVAIIRTQIGSSDKYQRIVYQYNGESWEQFDENYNAENVFFGEDLMVTAAVGNISLTNGQATISAKGKNLKQVFDTIFVKEKNPSKTNPSVNLTAAQNKAYEVGTSVTPSFTASLKAGSYTYGPPTGITANKWTVSDSDSHSIEEPTGSFDPIVVDDSTNYIITAVAEYGDGTVPVTNTGNPYASAQIKAGSASASSAPITGYRRGFYGCRTEKSALSSSIIRALNGKTEATPVAGDIWEIEVPIGALQVVFAYPATVQDVSSILDTNGMNAEVKTAFSLAQIDVEGYNNHTAIPYKVYTLDFANPNDTVNIYKVTL